MSERRLLREEGGFTLPEMLVTMLMMTTVLFALYSIFDMSLRVFSYGNDKVEAVENARFAMGKMERELKMAFEHNGPSGYVRVFCTPGNPKSGGCKLSSDATRISFGNDVGSGTIDRNVANCPDSTCATVSGHDVGELITYYFDPSSRTLYRAANVSTALAFPSPVPTMARLGTGCMSFTYLGNDTVADADQDPDVLAGGPPPSNCLFTSSSQLTETTEPKVKTVRITMNVRVERGAGPGAVQTLTTDVTLRNRAR